MYKSDGMIAYSLEELIGKTDEEIDEMFEIKHTSFGFERAKTIDNVKFLNINDLTIENLKKLVSECQDAKDHHQLIVSNDGDIFILPHSYLRENQLTNDIDCRFTYESFCQSNGYVGENAAKDDDWMTKLTGWIIVDWIQNNKGYIDFHI